MNNYRLMAAAAMSLAVSSPFTAPEPRRHEPPGGPQPKLSEWEKTKRRAYNQAKAVEQGRPANYASLPAKQKAKYRKRKK